ncbi:MAG: carboxypeptidase regulatory-like domain-containing protein [Sedimentisphaerales bacterium]|nr:carboxypeptidase regulatory-like domain-containing protein [Sedimentisphaerales bacterium]
MKRFIKNAMLYIGVVLAVVGTVPAAQSTSSPAAPADSVTLTGRVLDAEDKPVAGAEVRFVEMVDSETASRYSEIKLQGKITTEPDGAFSFSVPRADESRNGMITAHKEPLALGWAGWRMQEDEQRDIRLAEPEALSGVVVDENDRPVAGAEVFIAAGRIGPREQEQHLLGPLSSRLLVTTTDAAGRFTLTGLPVHATFEVGARKPRYATITSFPRTEYARDTLQFTPPHDDIRLVMPAEARIKGIVVEQDTGRPVPGVTVNIWSRNTISYFRPPPPVSKEEGTFEFGALLPDTYTVGLATPREGQAEWATGEVRVTLEAGQTRDDVKIVVCKGGILEVLVTDAATSEPISQAGVGVSTGGADRQYFSGRSDDKGLARIRLMPGTYQLDGAYKQGYSRERRQETVTIEEGVTKRVAQTLTGIPKIRGVVRDPAGEPVEGVTLKILPGGREEAGSDAEGRFEIIWDPGFWGDREDTVFCLVARHEKRNLATATDIGEDVRTLDVKLEPGVTLAGKVTDPNGKGIAGARIRTMLHLGNWGSTLTRDEAETHPDGSFQITAVPPDYRYSLTAMADGFGEQDADVQAGNAVDGRLDVGALSLPVANLSISGWIVDTRGQVVPNANISGGYGDGQPDRCETEADAQGRFTLDGVCAGTIGLRVDARRNGKRLSASIVTEGGAADLKIVVREGRGPTQYLSGKTYDQIIAAGGRIIAGVAVDEDGTPVADVPVGVCCHIKTREDGRTSWSYSSFRTMRDTTDEEGRFAIKLEEDGKYCLRFSPDSHAALIVYDVPVGKKDLKVTLPKGGTIAGRLVRLEKGEKLPIANVEVKLEQTDRMSYTHLGFDRDRTTTTDAEGRFRFEHVSAHMRPGGSRSDAEWDPVPRIWQISYGETSETVGFYDGPKTLEIELLVKPKLADAGTLLGKPLPAFEGIDIDLPEDRTKGKSLLLCFFDMNQRPSRHYVTQLKKKAQELMDADIVVAVVQAAEAEADAFETWAAKYAKPLQAGRIIGDMEAVKYTWSVQSLPWLVLTDAKHTVRAEGFAVTELDSQVTQMQNAQRER